MDNLQTTAPTTLPVTLDSVRLELKVHSSDTVENSIYTEKIWAAAGFFAKSSGYVPTSTGFTLNTEVCSSYETTIDFPRYPVTAINSVHFLDDDDQWVADTDYVQIGQKIKLNSPQGLHYKIVYTAGNAATNTIPLEIVAAIRAHALVLIKYRESSVEDSLKRLEGSYWDVIRLYKRTIANA